MVSDEIYVGFPICAKGNKKCRACGKYVNGNVMVSPGKGKSYYVCNVSCGLKAITRNISVSDVLVKGT